MNSIYEPITMRQWDKLRETFDGHPKGIDYMTIIKSLTKGQASDIIAGMNGLTWHNTRHHPSKDIRELAMRKLGNAEGNLRHFAKWNADHIHCQICGVLRRDCCC